ncbi:MAG: hypothetical protein KKA42_16765, partial [candidate division Zixibacteria bacterium]|nr:hypothetical protein [candidate division Zixibacteria bacterium]
YDISVDVNDEEMLVTWKRHGEGLISGYNIYVSKEPLAAKYPDRTLDAEVKAHNHPVFPGDTDPTDGIERYPAGSLENGVRYYVSVRVVFPDRTLSKPTREIEVVCGPRGDVSLVPRYSGDDDGYSFEQNKHVRADASANDLYFYTKDGQDFLASPTRLNGFLRSSKFVVLPFSGDYESVAKELAATKITPTEERVEIKRGDWVLVKCDGDTYALLKIKMMQGTGEKRRVDFWFAYSTLVGELYF